MAYLVREKKRLMFLFADPHFWSRVESSANHPSTHTYAHAQSSRQRTYNTTHDLQMLHQLSSNIHLVNQPLFNQNKHVGAP